jgi:TPR repeat protein
LRFAAEIFSVSFRLPLKKRRKESLLMKKALNGFWRSAVVAAVLMAVLSSVAADQANAIVRLLNSRASGSPRGYAEAAKIVAEEAAQGKPLQGFVIAVVSRERDAPPAARIDEATRKKYLDASRHRIEQLALKTNNSLAWYLLSIDRDDTNLLQRAALGGNVQALNAWGSMLVNTVVAQSSDTNEIKRVLGEAVGFFKRAAGDGDANGLYNLGMCHARGLGLPRDDEAAFSCFRSAAEKGHPEAINSIGWFFREGRVVPKNAEISARWFKKSADYRNAYGEYNYGLALHRGEGVKKDDVAAAAYFKRAADGGCIEAVNTYGLALLRGEGVDEDPTAALKAFLAAANAGFPPAMENVATCYERGKGVPADDKTALLWRIRSKAARGDRAAQSWLRQNDK